MSFQARAIEQLEDEEIPFSEQSDNHQRLKRRVWNYKPLKDSEDTSLYQSNNIFCDQISPKTKQLRADIKRVARFPFNIFIRGETGTGKTLTAKEIHKCSTRAGKPFMELNCANLSEHLVEAELFGYRKGAFTGADRDHKGLFEEADGGILFLDEIGDVPPAVQNKLLKAIDEKQIKRLGTNRYLECDVQIVTATLRNLPEMICRGEFREDLYCRLAVLSLEVPPLRERREDIPAIIDYYLRTPANTIGKGCPNFQIEQEAVDLLCTFDYPGNIRVLRNLIFELTSHIVNDEPISFELVHFALGKLRSYTASTQTTTEDPCNVETVSKEISIKNTEKHLFVNSDFYLRSTAREGDIILPFEVCILRQGETFNQWAACVKHSTIEATREATGGTMRDAAKRLGVTLSSLKSHFHRAKIIQT